MILFSYFVIRKSIHFTVCLDDTLGTGQCWGARSLLASCVPLGSHILPQMHLNVNFKQMNMLTEPNLTVLCLCLFRVPWCS